MRSNIHEKYKSQPSKLNTICYSMWTLLKKERSYSINLSIKNLFRIRQIFLCLYIVNTQFIFLSYRSKIYGVWCNIWTCSFLKFSYNTLLQKLSICGNKYSLHLLSYSLVTMSSLNFNGQKFIQRSFVFGTNSKF